MGLEKNTKKFLFAWSWHEQKQETGKDFPPAFWEEVMSLELLESHMFNGTWVAPGRLAMLVGAEEARYMIESGELKQKDKGAQEALLLRRGTRDSRRS